MVKNIMIQGTGSSVGKSIVTAALCRIFLSDGYRVAPFKSQNMALNSFATKEGLEMGRAQVVQAQACRLEPTVLMNPILLKPSSDKKSQVIINGRVQMNMDAKTYHEFKPELRSIIKNSYDELSADFDVIIIEGAGSPAEINLRENDIVNMGMAELVDAPVILVADIDKGGVFASIVGTLFLLNESEKLRVRGVIINKFRGDIGLLKPGISMLEEIIKIPVLGVIPYIDIKLEDEDSVTERFKMEKTAGEIEINVIRLPHISNFTDFDVFHLYDDVSIRYVDKSEDIVDPDIIIIPGSKNTIDDMRFLKTRTIDKRIQDLSRQGKLVIGICAGYQMLGTSIEDPYHIEGTVDKIDGLSIIDMKTVVTKEKITSQVKGEILIDDGLFHGLKGVVIEGYEIHMGRSAGDIEACCFIRTMNGNSGLYNDNVIGTYIHGIFDNISFSRGLLNNIRATKGLDPILNSKSFDEYREDEFNRLARIVRDNVDMKKIYSMLEDN